MFRIIARCAINTPKSVDVEQLFCRCDFGAFVVFYTESAEAFHVDTNTNTKEISPELLRFGRCRLFVENIVHVVDLLLCWNVVVQVLDT